jgi:hypothetical protein
MNTDIVSARARGTQKSTAQWNCSSIRNAQGKDAAMIREDAE